MSGMSDYLENALIDALFRGQPYVFPDTLYFALFTATPNDAGGGTEVGQTGTAYARVGVKASLANFSGTQAPGSVNPSSGNSGETSNNVAITFPTPTANWGSIIAVGVFDAPILGNLLFWSPILASKNIINGVPGPSFVPGIFKLQLDN